MVAKRGLGRGLDALIPAAQPPAEQSVGPVHTIPIERIQPWKGQPRQSFDEAKLDELAASMREHGLIEPLVVRRLEGQDDRYEIIAGERRWRAAQRAGLLEVMCIVREATPRERGELALVENLQREDLNPIEVCAMLREMIKEYGYTQTQLAQKIGLSNVRVSQILALGDLPEDVTDAIRRGKITSKHGSLLLSVKDRAKLEDYKQKALGGMTSSALGSLIKKDRDAKKLRIPARKDQPVPPGLKDLALRIQRQYGVRCEVWPYKQGMEIALWCATLAEADLVTDKLL